MASELLHATHALKTAGNQIIDAVTGEPVRLSIVGSHHTYTPAMVAQSKEEGFNCIRLSITGVDIPAEIAWVRSIEAEAARLGMKIIIDYHANSDPWTPQQANGLWYDLNSGAHNATNNTDGGGNAGTTTHEQFVADWVAVATAFKDSTTVVGYELWNEPLIKGQAETGGGSTWGDGDVARDLELMLEEVGKAIQAVTPDGNEKLIFAPGPQYYGATIAGPEGTQAPFGDLSNVGTQHTVDLTVANQVVYVVHIYPPYVADAAPTLADYNAGFGYLMDGDLSNGEAPVAITEMGANFSGTYDGGNGRESVDESKLYAQTLIDYANGKYAAQGGPEFTNGQQGMSTTWWLAGNHENDQLEGTRDANGNIREAQAFYYRQLQFNSTNTYTGTGTAAQPGSWINKVHANGMEYDVLLPAGYDPGKQYGVVVHLHELENASSYPDQANAWYNTAQFRSMYEVIVVIPKLYNTGEQNNWGGVSSDVNDGHNKVIEVYKTVRATYSIDDKREYVTGDSMGGIGTWDFAVENNALTGTDVNNRIFDAFLAMAGTDYEHDAAQAAIILKDVPFWAVHGETDAEVSNAWDRDMAQRLASSETFHYTELAGVGHWGWDEIRSAPDQDPFKWLFLQGTTGGSQPSPTNIQLFDQISGTWSKVMGPDMAHGVIKTYNKGAVAASHSFSAAPVVSFDADATDTRDVLTYQRGDGTLNVNNFRSGDVMRIDARLQADFRIMKSADGASTVVALNGTGHQLDYIKFNGAGQVKIEWVNLPQVYHDKIGGTWTAENRSMVPAMDGTGQGIGYNTTTASTSFAGAAVVQATNNVVDEIRYNYGDGKLTIKDFNPLEDIIVFDASLKPSIRVLDDATGNNSIMALNGSGHINDFVQFEGVIANYGGNNINVRWV